MPAVLPAAIRASRLRAGDDDELPARPVGGVADVLDGEPGRGQRAAQLVERAEAQRGLRGENGPVGGEHERGPERHQWLPHGGDLDPRFDVAVAGAGPLPVPLPPRLALGPPALEDEATAGP